MRKVLEAVGIIILAMLVGITWRALYGPSPLPQRIPTHFGLDGQPNAWGTPGSLWLLPAIGVGIYLVITLVALFPAAFNYPMRVTPTTRARLEGITLHMISCIKVELSALFLYIQWSIIDSVRGGKAALNPLLMPIFMGAVFVTVAVFALSLFRAARPSGAKPARPDNRP